MNELKPILAALALPPGGPLVLAALGIALSMLRRRLGIALSLTGIVVLWLVSCHAIGIRLSVALLPPVNPLPPSSASNLKVQAIVVLGGGISPSPPEYGAARPNAATQSRLAYGIWLARQAKLPLAFAGGVGWAATGTGLPTEGTVARQVIAEHPDIHLRWLDDQSRDTAENAKLLGQMLQRDGVRRIALVTDAWHMPRAIRAFQRTGLEVLPAPTGFPAPRERALLEWLPSAQGLLLSRNVLREWLGLLIAKLST